MKELRDLKDLTGYLEGGPEPADDWVGRAAVQLVLSSSLFP